MITAGFSFDPYGLVTHLAIASGTPADWYVLGFVAGSFGSVPVLLDTCPKLVEHAIWDGVADGQMKLHQGELSS